MNEEIYGPEWQKELKTRSKYFLVNFIRNLLINELKAKDKTDRQYTELDTLLCEVSGIFDGWHSDGTFWTEYDESIRKKIDEFRKKYTYIKKLND